MTQNNFEPIKKSIEINLSCENAFALFTDRMEEWWPLESHSIFAGEAKAVDFQARKGGRIVEVGPDRQEAVWGTVLVADPPHRLVFTWHPGREPETAQEVEVVFSDTASGCRVELQHRGWERYGEGAENSYKGYDTGWDFVFVQRFGGAAA